MLTWIIVILLILWLLGYFGPNVFSGFPRYWQCCPHSARYRGHSHYFETVRDRVDPQFVENRRAARQTASPYTI